MSIRQVISDRPWILAVLVFLLVVTWILSGSLTGDRPASPMQAASDVGSADVAARVQVRSVAATPIDRLININGRTAPARSVEIRAETDGRVTELHARRGQQVRRGDLIVSLDLRDRQARLEEARAGVVEHQTAYEAQLELKTSGYVSDTQLAETLARLESARAELTRAELDLQYMQIRAPFDGVIQEREVELGDFVGRGDTVVSFVDNTRIIVTGSIAEQDAGYVSKDIVAQARLVTGQQAEGRVRYVAPVADESTRTFTVELEIKNPEGKLPAGVTAQMLIPGGRLMAQKVAPSLLTLDDNGAIGLKIVDAYNRVAFADVEIARSEPDGVWVTGLPENATVITVGQGYVDVGVEVDPVFAEADTALAAESNP